MFHFLHTFNPEPILISLGPINIYWYGFFILLGAISALLITIKLASYYNIKKDTIFDLAFWLILGGIIGARLYHVFLELPYYIEHPASIIKIWEGGLAIHGGIIAGVIIIWIFAKIQNVGTEQCSFWLLSALLAPGLALAQAMGRWGNYFNQELFGLPTDKAWGIPISIANRPIEYINSSFFHPTFLYESLGNLLIFILLISLHVYIIKNKKQKNITGYWLLVTGYLILYSILRFSLEFIRIDATPEFLGLRFPQIVSLLIIILAIILTRLTLLLPKNKISDNIK
jgi:phosphatidylglycerol:prolipoprotein diacylglycerol transferase